MKPAARPLHLCPNDECPEIATGESDPPCPPRTRHRPRQTPVNAPRNPSEIRCRAHSRSTGGGGSALRGPPRERARGRTHQSHEERGTPSARARDTRRAGRRGCRTPRASPRGTIPIRGEDHPDEGLATGRGRRGGLRRRHERQGRRVGRGGRGRVHARGGPSHQRGGIRTRHAVQGEGGGREASAGLVGSGLRATSGGSRGDRRRTRPADPAVAAAALREQ